MKKKKVSFMYHVRSILCVYSLATIYFPVIFDNNVPIIDSGREVEKFVP